MTLAHPIAVAGASAALLIACASTPPGAHPNDMSAAEHREHASAEEEEARIHEAQYEPDAEVKEEETAAIAGGFTYPASIYNPTEAHLDEAAQHREHAAAHREAADTLQRFEDQECSDFPPETRSRCPLLGTVASADDVDDGVRITLEPHANREAVVAHMRCHLAYAATRGFEGMDACPLYVEGVVVEEDEDAILLEAEGDERIAAVQERTATHTR